MKVVLLDDSNQVVNVMPGGRAANCLFLDDTVRVRSYDLYDAATQTFVDNPDYQALLDFRRKKQDIIMAINNCITDAEVNAKIALLNQQYNPS